MKLVIDPLVCKAEGRCYASYPDLFVRGPDGKALVRIKPGYDEDDLRLEAQAAANLCPRGAILFED